MTKWIECRGCSGDGFVQGVCFRTGEEWIESCMDCEGRGELEVEDEDS